MSAPQKQDQPQHTANASSFGSSEQIRVELAAERTLLAWVRTGLAMMGFGFVVARFGLFLREMAEVQKVEPGNSPHLSLWFGTALVVLGVGVNVVSAIRHVRFVVRLRSGNPVLPSATFSIGLSIVLAALGTATAAYLMVLSQQ